MFFLSYFVSTFTYLHVPTYVRTHTHTHARTHARTHAHTYIHTYIMLVPCQNYFEWNEQQLEKMYLLTSAPNETSVSLRCPHEEMVQPWLSKMHPVKILIRLRECWTNVPLGADAQRYFSFFCRFLTLRFR